MGRLDDAIVTYQKAIETKPDYAGAHYNLGNTLKELGRLDESIARYSDAIQINPNYAEAYNNLGNAFLGLGKLDEAAASYREASSIKPDYAEAHYNLGIVLRDLRQLEEAVVSHQKALSIKPDFAEAYSNLGYALGELGRLDEAIACYQKVLAIKPNFAEGHCNLGTALKKLGRVDEAVATYQKALAIQPDLLSVQHILNSLLGNTTDCPPRQYVEAVFNSYANRFENHLINNLKYKMPSLLKEVFLDLNLVEGKLKKVIDLGCGTGLAGVEFRDIAESLIGIDLSENMIREAEKKNIYDELYVDDIIDRLESLETKFELFISSDVFIFIGNLRPLFQCVKQHSKKNALFIFSTEHAERDGFILRNSVRYAHSKNYVLSIATESGFELEFFTTSNLRYEKTKWIVGGIYILKRV